MKKMREKQKEEGTLAHLEDLRRRKEEEIKKLNKIDADAIEKKGSSRTRLSFLCQVFLMVVLPED